MNARLGCVRFRGMGSTTWRRNTQPCDCEDALAIPRASSNNYEVLTGISVRKLVVYLPTGLIHQRELDTQIERARASLGPEVAHVAYRIGEDSTGEASIFFRITLRDWATAENVITDVTGRIASILFDQVRPFENWGLRPYFNFRGDSDQQRPPDPDWI